MTLKQKKFAKAYVENGGNASKAALEVYDTTKKDAHNLGHQVLKKEVVKQQIDKLLDKSGLSLETLNDYSFEVVNNGIKFGKPDTKAAVTMLQFLYKLHNAVPSNKSTSLKLSMKGNLSQDNVDKVITTLSTLSTKSTQLIDDIS